MIKDAYVQYQSRKAAKDQFDAMELLPGRVKMERNVHYIDDETAAMNLHLALMMAVLEDGFMAVRLFVKRPAVQGTGK